MKLRHSLTHATYETRDDGTVVVETPDGKSGVFRANGAWVSGELREADPHLLGFIAGPQPPRRGPTAEPPAAGAGPAGPPALPRTAHTSTRDTTACTMLRF